MTTISDISQYLEELAPLALAADWDNVGLLVGDPAGPVERIMTCLTLSPDVAEEAIRGEVNLIVSHHPLPFRPLRRLATDETTGEVLWNLIRAGIAVYSPHTAFDSAARGVNQQLAERLGLSQIRPTAPTIESDAGAGTGRIGRLPEAVPIDVLAAHVKQQLQLDRLSISSRDQRTYVQVAVACGSGSSLLDEAIAAGCDTFITGDIDFHAALEGRARGIAVLAIGHFESERFAMEWLAADLQKRFPHCEIWASRVESSPFRWV